MNKVNPSQENLAMGIQPTASEMVESTRAAFNTGRTRPLIFREMQLRKLRKLLVDYEDQFAEALWKELRKNKFQACLDLDIIKLEIDELLKELKHWTKDEVLPINILAFSEKAFIHKDPYGVVLAVGPWNALCLSFAPLVGAIAAGNCCIVKPSELTPICSQLIADSIPKYLDKECFQVFQGGAQETSELLKERFDYIFYTGSSQVGKIVMSAAAKHLTPVTLELGGKCPVYIHDSANVEIAARRIIGTKHMNHGQACVGPDYILCSKKVEEQFIATCKKFLAEIFPEANRQENNDLSRIVNNRHFHRLKSMLDRTKGNIVIGGGIDEADNWIDITVITDVHEDDSLMEGEIFGPLLPIMTCNSPDEAIKFINSRPKPLAVYAFGLDKNVNMRFINETSSGGVTINDIFAHGTWKGLPFGGVGESGIGAYHGIETFNTFTHRKSVLYRALSPLGERLTSARYPPFKMENRETMMWFMGNMDKFNITTKIKMIFSHILVAIIVAIIVFLIMRYG